MSKQWQLRRGTTVENDGFTGAQGELTMDTDTNALRIHDGTTQGGHMIDCVVAWQAPTAANNYTWYRKYASGWVEQGGTMEAAGNNTTNLLIEMANSHYQVLLSGGDYSANADIRVKYTVSRTTTSFTSSGVSGIPYMWQVSGMAAN